MPDTILALHPDPKKTPTRIDKEKYRTIRAAMLAALRKNEQIAFQDLKNAVEANLQEPFEGSISWYTTTIKLDLEARGLIERVPGLSSQHLRLTKK